MIEEITLPDISNDEFLYRGIIESFWDYENDRPSSAIYKDSKGVSVDREYHREEKVCIDNLLDVKPFFSICKIKKEKVLICNAITKYLPTEDNIYHSEIHDSEESIKIRGGKAKKLRDASHIVYKIF